MNKIWVKIIDNERWQPLTRDNFIKRDFYCTDLNTETIVN